MVDEGAIHIGAVQAVLIGDPRVAAAVGQPRVPGAGEVVGEHERGVVGAADEDRLLTERDLGTGERPGGAGGEAMI